MPSQLLVHWSNGPLVHWSIGQVVHWSIGPLVHWSFGPLAHWSIGPLVYWSICPLVHWSIGSLVLWLNVKCQMPNVNKSKLWSVRTSGAPPVIFLSVELFKTYTQLHLSNNFNSEQLFFNKTLFFILIVSFQIIILNYTRTLSCQVL